MSVLTNRCRFECIKKGVCINEDNTCHTFIGCRFIRSPADKCALCFYKNVCMNNKAVEVRKRCKR